MSVEQVFSLIAALMLASCVRVQAQFGVEQPFFFKQQQVSPFNFTDISDLILWIDVSQATNTTIPGYPTNGQVINHIHKDLSPANHTTSAVGGPIYYYSSGAGDGSYPFLALTNVTAGGQRVGTSQALTNSTSFSMFCIWQPLGVGDGGPFWADAKSSDGSGNLAHVKFGSTSVDNLSNNDAYNLQNGADLETPASSRSTSWQVGGFIANGANSVIWLNTNILATGTVGTTSRLTNGAVGYSGWGASSYSGVNWCSINFARGLIYGRALSSNEVFPSNI